MSLRSNALSSQTDFLLARRWEAGVREAFDYQRLLQSLLPKPAEDAQENAETADAAQAEPDHAATEAWLEDFRGVLQQRSWSLGAEELRRGRSFDPLALGLASGALQQPAAAVEEDDLIQQWRLSRLETAGSRRRNLQSPPPPTHQALTAYGGVTLLAATLADLDEPLPLR